MFSISTNSDLGGMVLFSVVLNSSVHVIMYSYYFAALFGPKVQQKLQGIKKNITLIQMVIFDAVPIQGLVRFCQNWLWLNFSLLKFRSDPVYNHSHSMCTVFGTRLWSTKIIDGYLRTECCANILHVLWILQEGLPEERRITEVELGSILPSVNMTMLSKFKA